MWKKFPIDFAGDVFIAASPSPNGILGQVVNFYFEVLKYRGGGGVAASDLR